MEIYKIVVNEAGTTNSYVQPRIFFNQQGARDYAQEIINDGYCDDYEVGSVVIYRERPDNSLGWFVTCGMERITK